MFILNRYHISTFFIFAVVIIFLSIAGCNRSDEQSTIQGPIPANKNSQYIETGDLEALKARGSLRVLIPQFNEARDFLPRKGFPLFNETELLRDFAHKTGLSASLIYVEDFNEIIPMLMDGRGDLIAANMTITPDRLNKIGFTTPLVLTQEQIVVPVDSPLKNLTDLKGKNIAVQKSTSYYSTVELITREQEGIGIETVPDNTNIYSILDAVEEGRFDATIVDNNILDAVLTYDNQLKVIHTVNTKRAIAWGVRKQAINLKQALDTFIHDQQFAVSEFPIYKTDLAGIKKRKKLRVLTRNNAATYFLWKGQLMGFDFELAQKFAAQLGVKLEMIVPPSREVLFDWLLQGKGDLIAASLTINPELEGQGIAFSQVIKETTEMIVSRIDDKPLKEIADLAGRTVYVRKSSSYWKSISALIDSGIGINLQAAPEEMETEEIISKVAKKEYDLTVSDSHILDIELTWRDDVKAAIALDKKIQHGWAVRAEDAELLAAANAFVQKEYRGLFYNITHRKYFEKPRTIRKRLTQRVDGHGGGALSPYDDLVKQHVSKYGFDWRLILAQMYQESRFNPNAKSWAGAIGLMQIMPIVARQLDVDNLVQPEYGIEAGVRYMDWLSKRFESELLENERIWFILAAYNAGIGHVRDARHLARQMGWESSVWFGDVERAMLLLSKPEFAKKARHGYVRGSEPVKYVREIKNRYKAYLQLTAEAKQ